MNVLKFFTAFLLGILSTIVTTCIGVVFVPFIVIFLIYSYTNVIYNNLAEKDTPSIKDVFKEAAEKISQSKKSEE